MFGCSLFSKSHVYKLQNIWDLVSADTCIYEHLEEKFGERPSVEYFWQTSRCLETLQSTTWIAWCTFSKESKSKENPDKKNRSNQKTVTITISFVSLTHYWRILWASLSSVQLKLFVGILKWRFSPPNEF